MTLHYHGTPITPKAVLDQLAGKCFCVSFYRPESLKTAHRIGQSVLHDNGAFSIWRSNGTSLADWTPYYEWVEPWIANPVHWAIIPDEIDGSIAKQEFLIKQWPFRFRGAPVWHLNEPIDRLLKLTDEWPRVCFGSTADYRIVGSDSWHRRISEAFDAIDKRHQVLPWIHMLRGMKAVTWLYPFASVDSTDVARNHNRGISAAREMADRWDALQCPRIYCGGL